jgi:Rod binding domain-containing protein
MMDSTKLTITDHVFPTAPLKKIDKLNLDGISEEKKKQIAKDFESLLINKLLDEMKNTIGDWGFDKDGASKQIQGIFWLYLARDVANNGGLGLWKDIYQTMIETGRVNPAGKSMDRHL